MLSKEQLIYPFIFDIIDKNKRKHSIEINNKKELGHLISQDKIVFGHKFNRDLIKKILKEMEK